MNRLLRTFLAFVMIASSLLLVAQDSLLLTPADATYMNRELYPASVSQLQWIGQTNYYAYAKDNSIYKVGAKNGTETLLLDIDMLNHSMNKYNYDSIKRLHQLKFMTDDA